MIRQRLILICFIFAFIIVVTRLFYWQIVRGVELSEAASDQYYFKLSLTPTRGEILSADKSPLVSNKAAYQAYAEPKKITNQKDFAEKITELLNLDTEIIEERISAENIVWAPLAHKIDEEMKLQLETLAIPGLGFEKESKRYYPEASMAAQLLGFVGSDENGNDTGYFGLEGFYDQALKGKPGSLILEKDARGLPILLGTNKRITAENGQNLELYLDRAVQFIVETKLKNAIERYGAKEGLVVVMDPKTGGILASASFPAYDPIKFSEFDKATYLNPLVSATYEPGSTFKTLIMSAGLNEKVVEPKTTFKEEGPVKVSEYLIRTWNNEYHGEMTMIQVLERSSNPGMVFVGQQLGKDKLYDYLEKFGIGEKTGIDIEGEAIAQIRPKSEWREIELATASFGQGIAVTPIQMVRAVAALANKGDLMEPQVVKKLIDPRGKTIDRQPKKVRQVISPATARVITEMMVNAVDQGEAKWAKPPGYRIAGKTGTAQIPVAGHYDAEKTIASFVGFAPADDPKFVMLTLLREPSTSPWGSETAAPLFFAIAKELFNYYGISPP
ncbi:TPA: stage V sporulation protein D [Patescibacteria group bacterium]|uniref:Peptidoglycan glycosyltransferase n=1 Tax=Candidatus Gottesmanbacteria bacterium GW2011_GWA1_43_11 TaxID=1618436 RepID=A0A0G1CHA2_9BACT|nr:MAG: Peptidoglycan glycosyltransferase [Candidatus Gottesmanbacteria bacterium GW2011_GWA1_43_11]HCS78757.1 stage V sporulation protein D [Patescibacteria group bacterium]